MQPTRHALGALLLEQGHIEEAANAYAEDLGFTDNLPRGHQHPNNVWALSGYVECLNSLGRKTEAKLLEIPLKFARSVADIDVAASCYCRNAGAGMNGVVNGNGTSCCS